MFYDGYWIESFFYDGYWPEGGAASLDIISVLSALRMARLDTKYRVAIVPDEYRTAKTKNDYNIEEVGK